MFVFEKYKNLFSYSQKSKYIDELFNMLISSYESIGGIKGRGFATPDDMLYNIPFIKIVLKNNKIVAAIFYKDKNGRKGVAMCTDGTKDGYIELKNIMREEFKRSYFEVSHMMLKFLQKNFPDLFEQYKIPNNLNLKIFDNIIPIDDYFYKRKIKDTFITKIALGTPFIDLY